MVIRKYNSADCPATAKLFYNTVHTVNVADYSKEQLDAWAPKNPDLDKWDRSLTQHYCLVAVENGILIGFGDIDETGHIPLFTVLPGLLQTHADAVLGGADDDRRVGHGQSLHHLAGKVEGARSVQNIDLAALVLQGGHRSGDGNLALDLLRVIVAHGVAVHGLAHAVDSAGHIEQALRQSSFAASAVAQ